MNYIKSNTGKFFGTIIGIVIAIMILTIGLLKTAFITICAILGYIIGDKIDEGENLKSLILKIFSIRE